MISRTDHYGRTRAGRVEGELPALGNFAPTVAAQDMV